MSLLSANYYMSKEAILPLTFITGIGMAVNVLLDLILIPVHGPTGAALATTAGQIAVFVTCSLHQKKFGLHARLIWLKIPIAFLPTIIFIPLISSGPFVILALGLLGGLPVMAWVVWETFSLLRHQTKFESPPPVESS
jgi:peptidoglycan biosynthesis protein MviN/MurJ (putative lipid II flippase)